MRSAERREEVIERHVVCEIQDRQPCRRPEFLTMEQVVGANTEIEDMPRSDARRVVVRIESARGRDAQPNGSVVGRRALVDMMNNARLFRAAEESDCTL